VHNSGENAPGVNKETMIMVLRFGIEGKKTGSVGKTLKQSDIEILSRHYDKTGLQRYTALSGIDLSFPSK
jgi:hypothetical protein